MSVVGALPRLLSFALLFLAVGTGVWGIPRLRGLELFHVERVEISGTELLSAPEVLATVGLRPGQSVWDDRNPWLDALLAHPVIRGATIERSLPRSLRIRVEERQPVALIEVGTLRPVTAVGEILPVDPAEVPLDLPLIRVRLPAETSRVDDPTQKRLLGEIGRLTQLDPALIVRVSEVRATPSGALHLVLGQPLAELLLPPNADTGRLQQLRAVLEEIESRTGTADRTPGLLIDARFADQIVVRLSSSS